MVGMEIAAMVAQCAPTVAPSTMQAILRVESGFRPHAIGSLIRHPNGKKMTLARQPSNLIEAVTWGSWLYDNGFNFDAGPAQVNSANFKRVGLTAESAFDACKNIAAGGAILTWDYARAARQYGAGQYALRAAISAYNTGNFSAGFSNGYVYRVDRAAQKPMTTSENRPTGLGLQ